MPNPKRMSRLKKQKRSTEDLARLRDKRKAKVAKRVAGTKAKTAASRKARKEHSHEIVDKSYVNADKRRLKKDTKGVQSARKARSRGMATHLGQLSDARDQRDRRRKSYNSSVSRQVAYKKHKQKREDTHDRVMSEMDNDPKWRANEKEYATIRGKKAAKRIMSKKKKRAKRKPKVKRRKDVPHKTMKQHADKFLKAQQERMKG